MKPPLIILLMSSTLSVYGKSITWEIEEEQKTGTMILDIAQELGFDQPPDRTDTFSVSSNSSADCITNDTNLT